MKIGFFITARLKSSRLKHKVLLDLNNKSILDRVIERCKEVKGIDGVVLCTSTDPQDSILYRNALENKVEFFAGSENDVLQRLLNAALYFGYDAFLSITADNPLFSIYTSQIAVDWYKKESFDFIFTIGLPIGIGTYFIDTKALQVACHMKKEINTEIWGPFVNRPDFFKIGELIITNSPYNENYRLTCDYPEDYVLIRSLYSNFESNAIPSIHRIFDILRQKPALLKINSKNKQSNLNESIINLINENFSRAKNSGEEFARSINKSLHPEKIKMEFEI